MRTWLLVAAVLVATTALWRAATDLEIVSRRIEAVTQPTEEKPMQTLETTWASARGTEKVVTTKGTSETPDQFQARHDLAVANAQALHPKVG